MEFMDFASSPPPEEIQFKLPDISALHVYESSMQSSILNESSHMNLDEYIFPTNTKTKNNTRPVFNCNVNGKRKQENENNNIEFTEFLFNLNDKITEVAQVANFNTDKSQKEYSNLITQFQSILKMFNIQISSSCDSFVPKYSNQIAELTNELTKITSHFESRKNETEKLEQLTIITKQMVKEKNRELNDMIAKKTKTNIDLRELEDNLTSKTKAIGDLQITIMKLQRNYDEAQINYFHRKTECEDLETKTKALNKRIEENNFRISQIDQEINEVQKQIFDLDELRKLSEDDRNCQLDQLEKLQKQLRLLESQQKSYTSQKNELLETCEEFQVKINSTNSEIMTLKSETIRKQSMLEMLQKYSKQNDDELLGLKNKVRIFGEKIDKTNGDLIHKVSEIEQQQNRISNYENATELFEICDQFVSFMTSSLNEISELKINNKQTRKKLELEIAEMQHRVISKTLKIKVTECDLEANKMLSSCLIDNLAKLKTQTSDSENSTQVFDFENEKLQFIELMFEKLTDLNQFSSFSTNKTKQESQMKEMYSIFDQNGSVCSESSNFIVSSKFKNDGTYGNRNEFDRKLSQNVLGNHALKQTDSEVKNIDIYDFRERKFSRKRTPDGSIDLRRNAKDAGSPSRLSEFGIKRDLTEVGNHWLSLVKEMSNFVQFITKSSSIFANTISFFMSKFPKEGTEANQLRSSIIKSI